VVLANAELMGRGRAAGVAAREIETAGTRAAELTRQLLAYARQQVTSPTSVSVMQVMRAVEPILRRLLREDIRLHIEGDDLLFRVKIDPVQLEQVVLNLTVNARDAIDGAGSIYVRARNVSRVVAGVERELLCLAVRDTGHGMSAHTIAHVFEPFFTTKGPGIGTGLGLATVHTIVQDAAGFIEVESQVGEGSEFRVYLPRTTEEAAKTPASVRPGAVLASPRRTAILLVEDDALVRRSVARMLEDAELDVIEAASAMEARVTFLKNRQRIEVLLTDVVLTDASGIELAQVLRERAPQLAVLLMTGYADELARNAADIQSDWVLLNKPFSSRELRSALESVLLPSGPKRAVGG
jgi:CheY-like chemotaxis protein